MTGLVGVALAFAGSHWEPDGGLPLPRATRSSCLIWLSERLFEGEVWGLGGSPGSVHRTGPSFELAGGARWSLTGSLCRPGRGCAGLCRGQPGRVPNGHETCCSKTV